MRKNLNDRNKKILAFSKNSKGVVGKIIICDIYKKILTRVLMGTRVWSYSNY